MRWWLLKVVCHCTRAWRNTHTHAYDTRAHHPPPSRWYRNIYTHDAGNVSRAHTVARQRRGYYSHCVCSRPCRRGVVRTPVTEMSVGWDACACVCARVCVRVCVCGKRSAISPTSPATARSVLAYVRAECAPSLLFSLKLGRE